MHDTQMLASITIERQIGKKLGQEFPVIPLGELPVENGKGPRTKGSTGGTVLPDFAVAAPGYGYIDVKVKGRSSRFKIWNRDEHGIDLRLFRAYRTIEDQFKRPVALFVAELSTGNIVAATLSDLQSFGRPREGTWPNTGEASINWDRQAFMSVGAFEIPNNDLTQMRIVWNSKALRSVLRQMELPLQEASC